MGAPHRKADAQDALDYLCVDRFLRDVTQARALESALELGVVDWLLAHPGSTLDELATRTRMDGRGLRMLVDLLAAGDIVDADEGGLRLADPFLRALAYRDLMEAKLAFARLAAADYLERFTELLAEPERFFAESGLFELFSYDRCFVSTAENRAATARWVRITTSLTRYESAACLDAFDMSGFQRLLDVGGNSGEFALNACRRHPGLRATVCDLPVVCELGAEHVRSHAEASRIGFHASSGVGAAMPQGHDIVSFKSMLHDWPDDAMAKFLAQAHRSLTEGGTMLLFERQRPRYGAAPVPYSAIPLLLFFRSYRTPEDYRRALLAAGFRDVTCRTVELDMPFMLMTARR